MRFRPWLLLLAISTLAPSGAVAADVARHACGTLAARVGEIPGDGPVFLRSYDSGSGSGPASEPALNAAFTYDNALAAIALTTCGHLTAARRIADALALAAEADRSGTLGRLRNAYRPGEAGQTPVPPMGWWSTAEERWNEDPYQVGTATG